MDKSSLLGDKNNKVSDLLDNIINCLAGRPAVICKTDRTSQSDFPKIIKSNKAFQELFDFEPQEINGRCFDFMVSNNSLDYRAVNHKYINILKIVKNFKCGHELLEVNNKKGKKFDIIMDFNPLLLDCENSILSNDIYSIFTYTPISSIAQSGNTYSNQNSYIDSDGELEKRLFDEIFLGRISNLARSDMTIDASTMEATRMVCEHFKVDRCIVIIYRDDDEDPLIVEYDANNVKSILNDSNPKSIYKYIAIADSFKELNKSSIVISDKQMKNDEELKKYANIVDKFFIKSQLITKCSFNGVINAVIFLNQCHVDRKWTTKEIKLLESVAEQGSMVVERSKSLGRLTRSNLDLLQKTKELELSLQKEIEMKNRLYP